MAFDKRTLTCVAAVSTGGVAALAAALPVAARAGDLVLASAAVLAVFVAIGWAWPVLMYRNHHSECMNLDEGLLVVCLLTQPAAVTVVVFALATAVSQLVRRRALIKSVFNVGDMAIASGAATLAAAAIRHGAPSGSPRDLIAVLVGALVFFVVNTGALAAVMACASRSRFVDTVLDGLAIRALLVGTCVIIGIPVGLAVSAHPWLLAGVPLPFFALRQMLTGHFQARHDHSRISGLLESTLDVNQTMDASNVRTTLLAAVTDVLRCPEAAIESTSPAAGELAVELPGATDRWIVARGRSANEPFDDTDRALLATFAAVGSTALRNAELFEQARAQREQLWTLTSSLGEAVIAVDREGIVTFVNPAAVAILPGLNTRQPAPVVLRLAAARAMDKGVTYRGEDTLTAGGDGKVVPVALTVSPVLARGAVTGAVVVMRDITERKAFEEELARHAFEDSLTGLANRRLLLDRLRLALHRAERSGARHAVLFIDVDRFKTVNDSLGHHAGDQLLKVLAERMQTVVRAGDTLARLGGDEFVLLLEDVAGLEVARTTADRIADQLREPITVGESHEIFVSASVGIALSDGDSTADDLLRDADVAMYQAKSGGAGRRAIYDLAAMGPRSSHRLDLETALRRGIDRGELVIHYQPLVSTADRSIVGAEALVRWAHPERGLLAPAEFIGLAEDTGLILPIDQAVLDQACRDAREWTDAGFDVPVSVNLSARQFGQPDLAQQVAAALHRSGLEPDRLCLEIVETLAMENADRTTEIILALKRQGIRFAIDDFGTGYSSLNYLKRFPVDEVKIDRSFVSGLGSDPADAAIVRSVTQLVSALGMMVVAEGVETEDQLDQLRELQCGAAQGFLFSRPVPVEEFGSLLREGVHTVLAVA